MTFEEAVAEYTKKFGEGATLFGTDSEKSAIRLMSDAIRSGTPVLRPIAGPNSVV